MGYAQSVDKLVRGCILREALGRHSCRVGMWNGIGMYGIFHRSQVNGSEEKSY